MKKKLLFILLLNCLFLFQVIYAQEIIRHEKRMYLSGDGKLYLKKDLPVYLWISTSPNENSEKIRLKSEEMPQYTNPFYFDTEGYNTVRSPSAVDTATKKIVYPERDVIFEMYSDSKSPKTHIDYGKILTVVKGDEVYIGGLTSITLSAKDETSGVQKIYYSIDSADYKEYTSPINFNKQGEYYFQCYSVDNVGNHEEVIRKKLILDASNPSTKLEIHGDKFEDVISGHASLELQASDDYGIKAIYYSLDDQPEKIYTSKIYAAYLKQGDHTLSYYSEDRLGNKETRKEYKFYIDKTPPTIVEEIMGKSFVANGREFSSGRSKLKLTTFDNKAGVKEVYYSLNDGEYQLYDKPFYLSNSSGKLNVKTYAIDNVNNKSITEEQSSAANIPYIDLSGPALTSSLIGPSFLLDDTIYISNKTKISLKATDPESGLNRIEYRINEGDNNVFEEPFSIPDEGVYVIQYNGYDNVDNSNYGSLTVKVDSTGPEIFSRFSIPSFGKKEFDSINVETYPKHVVLYLSATDTQVGVSKIFYSLDSGKEIPYGGLINNFIEYKKHFVSVRALDQLGNENKEVLEFGIGK